MTIATTTQEIFLYALLSLKARLKLEIAGMSHSRGFSASKAARTILGSKTKNKEQLLVELQEYIAAKRKMS